MKCIVCHEREAVVPDRNTMSRHKRLCIECHAERLQEDLKQILKQNPSLTTEREQG